MKKKILIFVLVAIILLVAVIGIEFCCIYAVQGDNIWNYLKDFWDWYKTLIK